MKSLRTSLPGLNRAAAIGVTGVLAALGAAGCQNNGHGKYTSEGLSQSQERIGLMKSASEYEMAQQSFLSGDLPKALKHCDHSITINPSVPKSHVLHGRIELEMNRLDQAEASLLKAEALDQNNVEAQYYLGIIYERYTKHEMAFQRYSAAAALDPSNPQYAIAAAEMLIDLERYDEAVGFLQARKESFEHNAGVRQTLGHIALIESDNEKALEYFNEARILAPDDPAVLEDVIRAQIATSRYADADANLTRLLDIEKNSDRRDLKHMRAKCLIHLNRPVEARAILSALTSDAAGASDITAWIDFGGLAYMLNDPSRLRMAAQRVAALDPSRHEGYMLRAMLYVQQDQLDKALASVDKAVAARGKDIDPVVFRGVILAKMGRVEESKAAFEQALAEDPSNSTIASLMQSGGTPAASVPTDE